VRCRMDWKGCRVRPRSAAPAYLGMGPTHIWARPGFWGTNSPPLLTYLAIRNTKLLQWRYYLEPRLINSPDPLTCLVSLGLP